jgi:hypothetical protein
LAIVTYHKQYAVNVWPTSHMVTSAHCDLFPRRHKHKHFQIKKILQFPSNFKMFTYFYALNLGYFAKQCKSRVFHVIARRGSRNLVLWHQQQ